MKSKLQSLRRHVLDAANEVNYLVLVFGLPGYVAVNVREQHWRACGKIERYVVAQRSTGRGFDAGTHTPLFRSKNAISRQATPESLHIRSQEISPDEMIDGKLSLCVK